MRTEKQKTREYSMVVNEHSLITTVFLNNECTNLARLASLLFQNNYFSFLIHFWIFSFSTFQLSVFQLPLPDFLDFAEKLFCLAKRELYSYIESFFFTWYNQVKSEVGKASASCHTTHTTVGNGIVEHKRMLVGV